jgi:hypothetical protein
MPSPEGIYYNPDGTPWTEKFENQRPPFQPGNQLAVTHGAYSTERTDPIAQRYIQEVCSDPATSYLRSPAYHAMLWQWGVLMAQCELITVHMASMTFEERTNSDRGKTSPMDLYTRFSGRALALAKEMGFTPRSRAGLGKDVASTQVDLATLLSTQPDTGTE